jgi:phenylacetate-coenzyme A ligase PaaK-like adenylate-forming protein
VRRFGSKTLSLEESKALVRQGMQRREAAFLKKVESSVFGDRGNPYLKLFRRAGCEPGDFRRLVETEGVDGSLRTLRDAGVYVTFEEFKGRQPIRRGSDTYHVGEHDFDNKWTTSYFSMASGGSSGRPSRIHVDLEHIAQTAPHQHLWFAEHDWLNRPLLLWTSNHTGTASRHLLCARYGRKYVKWFCPTEPSSIKDRLAAACVHALVRNAVGLSRPVTVPVNEAWKVSEYLVQLRNEGQQPCMITSPSQAIYACLAADNRGLSLDGVTFLLGGEPLTPARRRTIEQHGAAAVPTYGFTEGGNVGSQCRNAAVADDIHVSLDAYAVIQHSRPVADDAVVDALLLTALRPACSKVLLNTEIGDYAVMTSHKCGCLFDEFGYHQHLHTIRSFDKLTGVGMTFVGADIFNLMEKVLPERFGGSAMDYQLLEHDDARGLPRYSILVSPEVGSVDEERLREVFLEELGSQWSVYRWMAEVWRQAGVLSVRREKPIATQRGKVLPFRTLLPAHASGEGKDAGIRLEKN